MLFLTNDLSFVKDTHEDIKISRRRKKNTNKTIEAMEIVTRVVNEGNENIKEKKMFVN